MKKLLLLLFLLPATALGDSFTITSAADADIDDTYLWSLVTARRGVLTTIYVDSNNASKELVTGLVRFRGLDDSLPSGVTVDSAFMTLTVNGSDVISGTDAVTIEVYRCLRAWDETSAQRDTAIASGADTVLWATRCGIGSGDISSSRDTVYTVDTSDIAPGSTHKIYVTPASVDSMNTEAGNNGWLFWMNPPLLNGDDNAIVYRSSENTTATNRPKITVYYTTPASTVPLGDESFGGGKTFGGR